MTITNASFEVAVDGQIGSPHGWAVSYEAKLEETAEFVGDSPVTLAGYETFDRGWSSASQTRITAFDVDMLDRLETERFDTHFDDQNFLYLTALEAFVFNEDTQTVEEFEIYEHVDADNRLSDDEIERAIFAGDKLVEDFSTGYGATDFALVGVAANIFGVAGLGGNAAAVMYEAFSYRPAVRVRASVSDNRLIADVVPSPSLSASIGDAVTFRVDEGSLPTPLEENTPYIVADAGSIWIRVASRVGADVVELTEDGFGAVYVQPDPGRFWFDEL